MDWQRLFQKLLHEGDVVFDIGAYQGEVSSFCSGLIGPSGRIVTFEPRKDHFKTLKLRARRLGNVTCESYVVSSMSGTAMFYFGVEPHASGASTIVPELANTDRLGKKIKSELVESISIDDYCARHSIAPSFIKLDVEGAEDLVMAGAENTLRAHKPAVYFEQSVIADTVPHTVRFLRDLGYEVAICDFFRFDNVISNIWAHGNYVTSDCDALRTKLITFDDDSLIHCKPMHTNMIAIHPTGIKRTSLRDVDSVELRDAVLQAVRPPPPAPVRKNIAYYAKATIKRFMPNFLLQTLRYARNRMRYL